MELRLNGGNIDVEFDEISIEFVGGVIQESVVLSLEECLIFIESLENWLDSFEVMVLKSLELLNGGEKVNQLGDSSAEKIKFTENLIWGELKLLAFWHVHESLLGELVLLKVSSIEVNAALKHWDELIWRIELIVPKNVIGLRSSFLTIFTVSDSNEVQDVELAVSDHLVGDFDKKTGHSLVGVVVSGDGVDHLDAVHQSWEDFLDALWVS
jgi:hypothetical protein